MGHARWLRVAALSVLVACAEASTSTEPGLFFPTKSEHENASMDALFQGRLVVRDGCVLIGGPGDYSVPIWPKGYTAERNGSGALVVADGGGGVIAVEGQRFDMGGGYVAEFEPKDKVESRTQQLSRVEEWLGYAIPERCLASDVYGVWSVGETHPLR